VNTNVSEKHTASIFRVKSSQVGKLQITHEMKTTNGRQEGRQRRNEEAPTEVQEGLKKTVTPKATGRRKPN
jgi:hypothetical protein